MSVLRQILAGDTKRFAVRLAFHQDPDEGLGASSEESLSWGAFQIYVNGENICTHLEQEETVVNEVHWYLLPMLEWFVHNWDPLFHEIRLPHVDDSFFTSSSDKFYAARALKATSFPPRGMSEESAFLWDEKWHSWWERHSLQSCRNGGLFPDLFIRRWQDFVELSWGETNLPGTGRDCRFQSPGGAALFYPTDVVDPLYEVIKDAVLYLISRKPRSSRLKALAKNLDELKHKRNGKRRQAWMAGLGIVRDDVIYRWQKVSRQLTRRAGDAIKTLIEDSNHHLALTGSCQAALMFGSLSPTVSDQDVMTLADILLQSYKVRGLKWLGESISTTESIKVDDPWSQGYDLAEDVVEEYKLVSRTKKYIDLDSFINKLEIVLKYTKLSDPGIRGVALVSPKHRPTIVVNENHPINDHENGKRFTIAHELCHILFDRDQGRSLAMASGKWAPKWVEQRANAFAAMLLMPIRLIRMVGEPNSDWNFDEVMVLSKALKTGLEATIRHLSNLAFIDETTRERWLAQASAHLNRERINP